MKLILNFKDNPETERLELTESRFWQPGTPHDDGPDSIAVAKRGRGQTGNLFPNGKGAWLFCILVLRYFEPSKPHTFQLIGSDAETLHSASKPTVLWLRGMLAIDGDNLRWLNCGGSKLSSEWQKAQLEVTRDGNPIDPTKYAVLAGELESQVDQLKLSEVYSAVIAELLELWKGSEAWNTVVPSEFAKPFGVSFEKQKKSEDSDYDLWTIVNAVDVWVAKSDTGELLDVESWVVFEQLLSGLVVLGVNPRWVLYNRPLVDESAALFPVGSSYKTPSTRISLGRDRGHANLLALVGPALGNAVLKLGHLVGDLEASSGAKTIQDLPEIDFGTKPQDQRVPFHQAIVNQVMALDPSQQRLLSDPEFAEGQFEVAKEYMEEDQERGERWTAEVKDEEVARFLKSDLDLKDIFLVCPSSLETRFFMKNAPRVLRALPRIYAKLKSFQS